MDPLLVQLGEQIRALREVGEWSQDQLAYVVGTSRNTIARIERGQQNPTFLLIAAIAAALQVKTSELVDGINAEPPELFSK